MSEVGRFLSALKVLRIEDRSRDYRGTWELLATLIFVSRILGKAIEVPRGFITDFASVPRIPVVFFLTGGLAHAAAVIHDWLYTTNQTDRATADAIFQEALIACGVSRWRAWLMWVGVRIGGGDSWMDPGPDQPDSVRQKIREAQ